MEEVERHNVADGVTQIRRNLPPSLVRATPVLGSHACVSKAQQIIPSVDAESSSMDARRNESPLSHLNQF